LKGIFSATILTGASQTVSAQTNSTATREGNSNDFILQQTLSIGGEDSGDKFGTSMDVSDDGTTAIVGAIHDGTQQGSSTGSAYIFTRNGGEWSRQQRIVANDAESGDKFGISVSITEGGNTALIGANGADQAKGAVYEFSRDGDEWEQQEKLVFDELKQKEQFGTSLAISNDGQTAFIGAPNVAVETSSGGVFGSGTNFSTGAVYLLEKSQNWQRIKDWYVRDTNTLFSPRFTANRPDYGENSRKTGETAFGRSISLSNDGNTALIGAPEDGNGSAYLVKQNDSGWSHQNFSPEDADTDFGTSVSLSGDGTVSLVTAPDELNSDGRETGAAYVINNRTGSRSRLTIEADTANDQGTETIPISGIGGGSGTISSSGDIAVINSEDNSPYLFARIDGGWRQEQELKSENAEIGGEFGYETEFFDSESNILISDPFADDKGAVFSFKQESDKPAGGDPSESQGGTITPLISDNIPNILLILGAAITTVGGYAYHRLNSDTSDDDGSGLSQIVQNTNKNTNPNHSPSIESNSSQTDLQSNNETDAAGDNDDYSGGTVGSIDHQLIPETIPSTPRFSISYDNIEKGNPLGSGGNADVYQATAVTDTGEVPLAIKQPRMGETTLDTDAVDGMLEEAETWQQLDEHEHIVSVIDFDSTPLPWIAMEYMDGGDLGERTGELSFEQALWTALAITKGVRYAHKRGVAHLDLKPSNILFRSVEDAWDAPKVADWGLSKHLLEHSQSVDGMSPRYAAPEQLDSKQFGQTDTVTDVYQLGTVLYELFTGEPPFEGQTYEVMNKIQSSTPAPPSDIADLPEELDNILLTALATEKADRYDDVLYIRDALQELWSE
jgi:hypothetical protein